MRFSCVAGFLHEFSEMYLNYLLKSKFCNIHTYKAKSLNSHCYAVVNCSIWSRTIMWNNYFPLALKESSQNKIFLVWGTCSCEHEKGSLSYQATMFSGYSRWVLLGYNYLWFVFPILLVWHMMSPCKLPSCSPSFDQLTPALPCVSHRSKWVWFTWSLL